MFEWCDFVEVSSHLLRNLLIIVIFLCEKQINIMEEIMACRVCLATDTKLFNLFRYDLAAAYEMVTGTQISPSDGHPHQICSFCHTLLLKCVTFLSHCRSSQELMNYAVLQQQLVSTDYIRTIDRQFHNLTRPYTQITICNISITEPIDNIIKEENSTDEEPLSKIAIKKSKKKKKKHTEDLPVIKQEDLKNDSCNDDYDDNEHNFDNDQQFNGNNQGDVNELTDDIEVVTLTRKEQIEEFQQRKESLNYKNSFFKCELCFKGFMTDATYKNHMAKHDPSHGRHACAVCHTRCVSTRALRAHERAAHEKKYICRRCNHISKSTHKAREHSKWHDGFMFVCNICGASFKKSTSHLTHLRLQHPTGSTCELCGESFIGDTGLNMHKRRTHRDQLQDHKIKCEHACGACGAAFASAAALRTHLARVCDPTNRPCTFCGERFLTEESLSEHLKTHEKDGTVKCAECNRKFANARSYAVHYQRFHLGMRTRPSQGGRGDSVVCEVCGKKCISKTTLVYHMRTHTGEKPYQCTECPKRFSVFQRLQIHHRTHTGERPFKCSHCPKAFKHKAALNRHDRVHTGSKPYGCAHCGKAFSQSNSMKTHVRTVHLKLPAPYRSARKKDD